MKSLDLDKMARFQRKFVADRQWEKFHTPKNLSIALAVEAAELMEQFQWHNDAAVKKEMAKPAKAKAVADEMADVLYYLKRATTATNSS